MLQTRYKLSTRKYENLSNVSNVQRSGYIPANKKIESLIQAGVRLRDYRLSQYDFPDGKIDESAFDPTRRKGFDLADVTIIEQELEHKKALKASQTAQEPQNKVLETKTEDSVKVTE